MKGFPGIGAAKTGGFVRYYLISWNASWHLASQTKSTPFFINREKGRHLPDRLEINRRIYASLPWNPFSSFRFFGGGISRMALTFTGSSSMPCFRTTNPRNLPDETPKKHSYSPGFIRSLCFRSRSNTLRRSSRWSSFF